MSRQPQAATSALRILDEIEAAYARSAPKDEIDALWARYHEKERAVLWLLDGLARTERTIARLAARREAQRG